MSVLLLMFVYSKNVLNENNNIRNFNIYLFVFMRYHFRERDYLFVTTK